MGHIDFMATEVELHVQHLTLGSEGVGRGNIVFFDPGSSTAACQNSHTVCLSRQQLWLTI